MALKYLNLNFKIQLILAAILLIITVGLVSFSMLITCNTAEKTTMNMTE